MLTRDTVLASSNAGAAVSLPAGVADVFAWIDGGDRVLIESAAAAVTLTAADLGNLLVWTGTAAGTVSLPAIALLPDGVLTVQVPDSGTTLNAETATAYALATAKDRFGVAVSAIKAVIVQYGPGAVVSADDAARVAGL